MPKIFKIFIIIIVMVGVCFLSWTHFKQEHIKAMNPPIPIRRLPESYDYTDKMTDANESINASGFTAKDILKKGNGILFMETTDRMEPPSLVLCAIESAARVYPDRPVVYFMKGLDIITEEDENRTRERFPTLASFSNIYFFPLRMNKLFDQTPLIHWFRKVNPNKERYWTHVSSDACRFAMIWKYGGIYMDADVISIRRIPNDHFLAGEHSASTSSSVFGLPPFHNLTWTFMKDFVDNYNGDKWGHQGPDLLTRVVTALCGMPEFTTIDDVMCANIYYLHPHRFYPIPWQSWEKYFQVYQKMPTFPDSYALHLWNYMNKDGIAMVPGSNTLVEQLYQKQCPTTYEYIIKHKKKSYLKKHLLNCQNA